MVSRSSLSGLMLAAVLALPSALPAEMRQEAVSIFQNGKKKEVVGLLLEGRTAYLPDVIATKYYGGAIVPAGESGFNWELNGRTISFSLDSSSVTVAGHPHGITNAPRRVNGYNLIPFTLLVSAFFENLSKTKTYWYQGKMIVSIRTDRQEDRLEALLKEQNRVKTVIIDAGHGGHDVGAKLKRSPVYEKGINLNVARELYSLMKKMPGFSPVMTRDTDVFITLDTRTKIAADSGADLFVSIHANACGEKRRSGFEVYFLSETASDSEAEEVAAYENSIIDLDENADYKKKVLESILFSLGQNEFINESSELAYFISEKVTASSLIHNRGVKQAGFFVLRGVMSPSVLVELGYMTNKRDLKLLRSQAYQKKMAKVLLDSIVAYFERREKWNKG